MRLDSAEPASNAIFFAYSCKNLHRYLQGDLHIESNPMKMSQTLNDCTSRQAYETISEYLQSYPEIETHRAKPAVCPTTVI